MTLAETIRTRRTELGLTQRDLAVRVHCDRSHVANLEAGRAAPSLPLLRGIAAALGLDLGVLSGSDPPPDDAPPR